MTNLPLKDSVLVTLADRNFVTQAKQLFSSVYWNAGWGGDYLLLAHGDISEQDLKWFRDKGIAVFPCEPLTDKETAGAWHPAVVLDKFYLFTPYFKRWKRVVYLDADIIVRASLNRLLEVDGFAAPETPGLPLALEEFEARTDADRALLNTFKNNFKLRGMGFNTGVMAFSTEIITNGEFSELLGLYRRWGSLNRFGEQGTINLFFYRRWKKLSWLYNAYPRYLRDRLQIPFGQLKAAVIHFVHEKIPKPWDTESFFYSEWRANLERANAIDVRVSQAPAERWTAEMEQTYLSWIRIRARLLWYRRIPYALDWVVGQIGRLVRRISPEFHVRIRPRKSWFLP